MKKQIACTECKGSGYITLTRMYDDLCGIGCKPCPSCNGTGFHEVDITNADRIRAMSDTELEAFLIDIDLDKGMPFITDWGKWLKQPTED